MENKNNLKLPLISVITVCFNAGAELENTIRNFLQQTYKEKELVIIDGGSNDNTIAIIKKYGKNIKIWISEKDNGIYDAMNKGISLANGHILHFLNAGDYFYNENVLKTIAKIFVNNEEPDIIYGLAECFYDEEKIKYISGSVLKIEEAWKGMPVCHQSIFFRDEIFNLLGNYDLRYKNMADYELLLRIFHDGKNKLKSYYVNLPLSKYSLFGQSSKDYLKNLEEIENIVKNYYNLNLKKKFFFPS